MKKFVRNSLRKYRLVLIALLFTAIYSFTFSDVTGLPHHTNPGDSAATRPMNMNDLSSIIDRMLNQDSINERELAFVEYYSKKLIKSKQKLDSVPASSFYDEGFDLENVFTITPESIFPDSTCLVLQNDSLGDYFHPYNGIITSCFGMRDGKMHKGVDIHLKKGDKVLAAFDGKVRLARKQGAFGNVVIIRHYNGLETVYAHLSKIKVKPGQVVLSGQLLGLGGSTGRSSGPHLHLELRFKGQALNPANIISFEKGTLESDTIVIKKSRYGIAGLPAKSTIYTVKRGDSWYEIAKRYGHSTKELCSLNGIQKKYYLKVGQKLRVN